MTQTPPGKKKRGFASMTPEKQREIARKGGKAAHEKGTAHEFSSDEAREAGRKGGQAVSRNREHMAKIGREGGHARAQKAQEANRASSATNSEKPQESSSTNGGEDTEPSIKAPYSTAA